MKKDFGWTEWCILRLSLYEKCIDRTVDEGNVL